MDIQEKLFYTIGEVSKITGIEPYVLRYWESEFKHLSPQKNLGGQRSYRKKDIETILKIKNLLYEQRYTISGAKKKIKDIKPSNFQMELVDVPTEDKDTAKKDTKTTEVISKIESQIKSLIEFLDKSK